MTCEMCNKETSELYLFRVAGAQYYNIIACETCGKALIIVHEGSLITSIPENYNSTAPRRFCAVCLSETNENSDGGFVYCSRCLLSYYRQRMLQCITASLTEKERYSLFALGLNGESGEVSELLKKFLYHGKPLHMTKMIEELGDVLFYLFLGIDLLGVSLEAVLKVNLRKLRERHPNGFNNTYSSDSGVSE